MNPYVDADQLHPLLKPFHDEKIEEWEVGADARDREMTFPKLLNSLKPIGKELCFKHLNRECTKWYYA